MSAHSLQRWSLVLFSVCLMAAASWAQTTGRSPAQGLEVIDLKHRTADEVIPALRPLLDPGGVLSGDSFTLFVRTSPANLAQLRRALEQIDRRQNQYLISVRNSTRQEIERERLAAAAAIGTNGARATIQATDDNARRQGNNVSSVLVLEGNEAFIAIAQNGNVVGTGFRNQGNNGADSGIAVTPRSIGEQRVMLEIDQQIRQRSVNGRVDNQSLITQISGRLGEWIELGGSSNSSSSTQSGILSRSYSTSSDERSVWVKIELSP